MLDAIPQILQLGTVDDGVASVEGAATAVSALEKILDESSLAPGLRCRENGPSVTADGTSDEDGAAGLAIVLFPPPLVAVPDDASGLEFRSDVVN